MLAPGMTFTAAGRTNATIGAGTVPDFFNEGVGFMANGNLAMDSNAPSTPGYDNGIAQSVAGAYFVTTATNSTDVWIGGVRVSALGQIIIESADPVAFSNGNPVTAAGNFAVN